MIKKTIIAVIFAASLGSVATLASAAIIMQVAPPPPRVEIVPAHRPGYVWVDGHWGWRNHQHQWVQGKWIRNRQGYYYNQPVWVERDDRWHYQSGNWRRGDRDHDGVPNGQDRAPKNPNRY